MATRKWTPSGVNGIPKSTKNLTRNHQSYVGVSTTSTVINRTTIIKAVCNAPIPKTVPVKFYQGANTFLGTAHFDGVTATLFTTSLGTGTNTTIRAEWPGEGRYEGFMTYSTQTVTVAPGEILNANFNISNNASIIGIDQTVELKLSATTSTNLSGTTAAFFARKSNGTTYQGPLRNLGVATFVGNTATLVATLEGPLLESGTTFDYITSTWSGGDIGGIRYQGKEAANQPVVIELREKSIFPGELVLIKDTTSITTKSTSTFTVNVSTSTTITGAVTFFNGTATLGTSTFVNNSASITIPANTLPSTQSIYAYWPGTNVFPLYYPLTSNTLTNSLVAPTPTTIVSNIYSLGNISSTLTSYSFTVTVDNNAPIDWYHQPIGTITVSDAQLGVFTSTTITSISYESDGNPTNCYSSGLGLFTASSVSSYFTSRDYPVSTWSIRTDVTQIAPRYDVYPGLKVRGWRYRDSGGSVTYIDLSNQDYYVAEIMGNRTVTHTVRLNKVIPGSLQGINNDLVFEYPIRQRTVTMTFNPSTFASSTGTRNLTISYVGDQFNGNSTLTTSMSIT